MSIQGRMKLPCSVYIIFAVPYKLSVIFPDEFLLILALFVPSVDITYVLFIST